MRAWILGVLVLFASCVQTTTKQCGEYTCPGTYVCAPAGDRCVPADALTSCEGKADDASCEAGGFDGVCRDGLCEVVICGNGRVDVGEACDDGNISSGDGCNASCRSDETCGNGVIDPSEGCDCGDGAPGHANESCDMANSNAAGATCRTDCTSHACGDGVVEGSEQCETGAITRTCTDFGFYEGTLGCNSICQFDTTTCAKRCGDGFVNGGTETCDVTPPIASCLDFGYDAGRIGCSKFCTPAFETCEQIGWLEYMGDTSFGVVWAGSKDDAWGGGFAGHMIHWNGFSWAGSDIPGASGNVRGVWGPGTGDVYAVLDGKVFRHASNTWSEVLDTGTELSAISGSGSRIIAVGQTIRSWNGSTWETHTMPEDYFSAVHVVSPTEAYAVGTDYDALSWLYKWTGGTTWTKLPTPPMRELNAVWATGPNNIYIGGFGLMRWDGTRWESISLGVRGSIDTISGSGPNDIFVGVGGASPGVAHFDGVAWSIHDVGTMELRGVAAAGGGYAFGAGAHISRYLGTAWAHPRPVDAASITGIGGTSASNILAVGERGLALAFNGAFWRTVPGDTEVTYRAASLDIAVGDLGTVATFDGTRLTRRPSNTIEELNAVWAASSTDAWAVGDNGTIVHFDGTSATTFSSGTTNTLTGIWGFSASHIYAVGDGGVILHYNGTAWSNVSSPTTENLKAIWGPPLATCPGGCFMIVGDNKAAYHWTGNGNAWITDSQVASGDLTGVYGTSAEVLIATNTTNVWRYVGNLNSVGTWSQVNAPRPIAALGGDATTLYAGGPDLELQLRTASGFTEQLPRFAYVNERVRSMWAATAADAYAVMMYPERLLHFDGRFWSTVTTPLALPYAVSGTASNDVFVTGSGTAAIHWNGSTWQTQTLAYADLFSVHAASSSAVFAAGINAIRRYTGSWATTASNSTEQLNAVWTASATDAWAVGSNGTVLRYNGTWTAVTTTLPGDHLYAVWGAAANSVYVAGGSVLGHYDGTSWTRADVGGATLIALWGSSANDIFAGGAGGRLLHFDGVAWSVVRTGLADSVYAISGSGKTTFVGSTWPSKVLRHLRRDVAWGP